MSVTLSKKCLSYSIVNIWVTAFRIGQFSMTDKERSISEKSIW